MEQNITLSSHEAQDGSQSLHVHTAEAGPDEPLRSPVPAAIIRRSSVLDAALSNTSGPIPLPISAEDFHLWLHRSSKSIEDRCRALQVAEYLCDTELPQLEHEVAMCLSNSWTCKFHRGKAHPQHSSKSIHGLSSSLRRAILTHVSLHTLLCLGPADLQAEAIAAQVSASATLSLNLPSTSLLAPRTLFSPLTFLISLFLDADLITDSRWLSDLFQILPTLTSLSTLALTNFLRGAAELSVLLHSLSQLTRLTSLTLEQHSNPQLDLPRPIQTPLLPALPSLRSLHLRRIPIHLLGYPSTATLARDLTRLPSLSALHLTDTTVPSPDLPHLLKALSSLPALQDISLDHAQYLPETAMAILRALSRLTACRSLSLACISPHTPGTGTRPRPHPLPPGTLNVMTPPALSHLNLSNPPPARSGGADVMGMLLEQLSGPHAAPALQSLLLLHHRITRAKVGSLLATLERAATAAAAPLLRLEIGPMTPSTRDAAPRLAAALAALTALTRLSLRCAALSAMQIADVLRRLPRLQSLDVRCAGEGRESAHYTPQRMPEADVLCAAADALSRLTELTELSTNWPRSLLAGDGCAVAALGGLQELRRLRIECCPAEAGAEQAFAAELGRLTALESLAVVQCGLFQEQDSAEWLAGALRRMPGITSVSLLGGAMSDARQVGRIVAGLQRAWGLRELRLSAADVPLEDTVRHARALPCKAQLVQVRRDGYG